MAKKVTVTGKQIGRNFNLLVDDGKNKEKFTKMGTKEELEPIKTAYSNYVAKPTAANLKSLLAIVKPETTKKEKEKTVAKAEVKAVKNRIKEAKKTAKSTKSKAVKEENLVEALRARKKAGTLTDEDKKEILKLLQDEKAKPAPAAVAAPVSRRYSGEH
jgi:hypothetical protein